MHEYCRLLGLRPGSSWEDARRAYAELCEVWQPERFNDDPRLKSKAEQRSLELAKAYEFLESQRGNSPSESLPSSLFEVERMPSVCPPAPSARNGAAKTAARSWSPQESERPKAERFGTEGESRQQAAELRRHSSTAAQWRSLYALALSVAFSGTMLIILWLLATDVVKKVESNRGGPPIVRAAAASSFYAPERVQLRNALGSPQAPSHSPTPLTSLDEVLQKRLDSAPELVTAADGCDLRQVRRLLNGGADINAVDHAGESALIRATKRNCLAVAKMLIASGAKTDLRAANGFTALRWAESYNYRAMKQLLEGK